MYYSEIKNCDIANGLGVRVSLFVSGCTNHCEQCFQPQTWDFLYGKPFTAETEAMLLEMLSPSYIRGLTLLGGEPFCIRSAAPIPPKTSGPFPVFAMMTSYCGQALIQTAKLPKNSYH